jgi:hypothetical protein
MEFTVTCPIDGSVDVSLEDIDTVVLREPERADITFVCPHCGTDITVSAVIPSFLLAAIEALADEPDAVPSSGMVVISSQDVTEEAPDTTELDDPLADAYCEYFRRQLEHIGCVEDALEEIDSRG